MKKVIYILTIISLLASFAPGAKAHPGRTDSNGGHTDNSTGEYHYHHGYSAHDHYDMDGDGDVDCPYDFKDKTGANSGSPSSNKSQSSNYSSITDSTTVRTEIITKTVTKEVSYIPSWMYWVIGILIVTILIMALVIKAKCKEIARQERMRKDEDEAVQRGLANLQVELEKKYGKNWLCILCDSPDGHYIGEDNLPHSTEQPANDRYTFFLGGISSYYGSRYHHISCRYAQIRFPVNAYTIQRRRTHQSCSVCFSNRKMPDLAWVDRYMKHYVFLSKYIEVSKHQQKSEEESKERS